MADQTGTNTNNVFFFQGEMDQLATVIYNPYSGLSYSIDDEYNVNTDSYDGLAGYDTLFMTNFGDALFIRDLDSGEQMVANVEVFFAGDGGDVIHLADTEYTLGDITIDGGAGNDILFGNIGDDLINGRRGDDIIDGGPGDDWLNGGDGSDVNSGDDWLSGGAGADYLNGEDGNDTLNFFVDGTFTASFGAYNIGSPGVAGTSTFVNADGYNMSLDIFDGGAGYDTLVMTDGDDMFFLDNPYHDYHQDGTSLRLIDVEQIDAGAGNDVVDLTHDTISYGDIVINGEEGNDYLWSSSGDDVLNGGTGNDHLYGGFGDDELNGDQGNDELYGSLGNDLLRGGAGNDILYGGASVNSEYVVVSVQEHSFDSVVTFPDLQEKVDIADLPGGEDALGIAAGDLAVDYQTTAEISFVESGSQQDNSLGFYNINADGTIESVEMVFANAKDYSAGDTVSVDISGDAGSSFGFFMITNGANKNEDYSDYDLENGTLQFVYNHGKAGQRQANINDSEDDITLVYSGADGAEDVVVGSNNHIYHTTSRGGPNNLNSDGETHVVSGTVDGSNGQTLRIGFEDKRNLGDEDYNDLVFDVNVAGKTTYTVLEDDNDVLMGGAGDDYLDGGIGDDVLFGGEGNDVLYGDQGADLFLFQSIAEAGDTIVDFDAAEGDSLNITDLLTGFDESTDDLNDFMQLVEESSGDVTLEVNADGQGNDFTALVTFEGGLGGTELSDLITDGNLVVDQSIVL